jgi:hypothetical protein
VTSFSKKRKIKALIRETIVVLANKNIHDQINLCIKYKIFFTASFFIALLLLVYILGDIEV